MFLRDAIYNEPDSENYELGKILLNKYKEMNIPNNITQIQDEDVG